MARNTTTKIELDTDYEIVTLFHNGLPIRATYFEGAYWFCVKDMGKVLGIGDTNTKLLKDFLQDKASYHFDVKDLLGRYQPFAFAREDMLYHVIACSRYAEAITLRDVALQIDRLRALRTELPDNSLTAKLLDFTSRPIEEHLGKGGQGGAEEDH